MDYDIICEVMLRSTVYTAVELSKQSKNPRGIEQGGGHRGLQQVEGSRRAARPCQMVAGAAAAITGDGGGQHARGHPKNGTELTEKAHGEQEELTRVATVALEA